MFDATTLFTLAGKLVLDSNEFNSSVNQAKGTFSGLGMSMDSAISKVKRGLVALTGGLAIGKLLKMGLSFNQQIQNYSTNFGVLLQNEQKGIEMTERLKEMAAKTPFGITDLAGATQSLLAYGVEGEKVEGVLSNIGDIALGDKNKLQSIATVFGQISMAGKLLTQDYKQLLGQGFNPLTYISKRTGESLAELQDRMSKGGITIEEVTQAFKDATSEGGQFYQGMEKASETTSGLMSTLSDNWTEFIGNFTQPINDQLSEKVLPATISALGRISDALFGAEEASKKTKAELYGTDENGNDIDPNANLTTWYESLIKTWTDGLPETDAIVNDYVTSFNTETDRIKKAMQDRLLDTANPLTEEQKVQFESGIADVEAMQARVNELLQKKANGTLTEDEKNELLDFLEKLNQYNSMLEGGSESSGQTPLERIMDKVGTWAESGINKVADWIVATIDDATQLKEVVMGLLSVLVGKKALIPVLQALSTVTGIAKGDLLVLSGTIALIATEIAEVLKAYNSVEMKARRDEYEKVRTEAQKRNLSPLQQADIAVETGLASADQTLVAGTYNASKVVGDFLNGVTFGLVRKGFEALGLDWESRGQGDILGMYDDFFNWRTPEAMRAYIADAAYQNAGVGRPDLAERQLPQLSGYAAYGVSDLERQANMPTVDVSEVGESKIAAAAQEGIENATVDVTVNIDGMALRRSQNQLGRRFNYAYGGGSGSRPSAMRE